MKTYFGIHLFEVCHVAHFYEKKQKQKTVTVGKKHILSNGMFMNEIFYISRTKDLRTKFCGFSHSTNLEI